MMNKKPLSPAQLYKACNLEQFQFNSTAELEDIDIMIGQERAIESLRFGIHIAKHGYNIFALAPAGTGKLTSIKQLAEHEACHHAVLFDWCYVNNFQEIAKPKTIAVAAGKGKLFQQDMEQLIDELSVAIPAAFDGDEYRQRSEEIEDEYRQREVNEFNKLRQKSAAAHILLTETPTGYAFAPTDEQDNVISPEQFNKLDEAQREKIQQDIVDLHQYLQKLLKQFPQWRKETRRKLQALNKGVAELAVNHLIETLKTKYAQQSDILAYLVEVNQDIIEHVSDFIPHKEQALPFIGLPQQADPFKRYRVNLLVDFSGQKSAPVIYEDHPNYANLLGRVEHQAYMGSLMTDFTLIKAGAFHKANGGYLILDARKLLTQPYAWECLKRTLQTGEIKIESLEHSLSLISSSSLEPEPIPLQIKVILFGDRIIYYLLNYYDPEFQDLFKIAADFDDSVPRCEADYDYARLLTTIAKRENLRPLTPSAVARVIEQSARLTGDAEKLSMHLRSIKDLLTEADYWAGDNGHELIAIGDVQQAIDHKIHRLDRVRARLYETIQRGTLMIETEGSQIGQINALSILQLGEFSFGQPSRITAVTRLGNGKVVDIEKETELGGAFHSKGVLILSSYIASHYARNQPFSMTASLVFEQSYNHVEGDSASLAELCVILSSLAQVPLRQDLAITGSVNQLGRVQAIGGVNEKIEGFFDICKQRDLTGTQGVIIPASNINYLMLRWDVVHAAQNGQFHVYAVETVAEALELLTDLTVGELNEQGHYPAGSFNAKVDTQLRQFTAMNKEFSSNKTTN
ncbi:MAG: peptidase S16 lon domain-containing protein [Methylococcaceae bacterium NSP1-2]|nr:MAG: peptidase S16 lon domain-containing protein [Methylococcaceae bacterium NSP1-2]